MTYIYIYTINICYKACTAVDKCLEIIERATLGKRRQLATVTVAYLPAYLPNCRAILTILSILSALRSQYEANRELFSSRHMVSLYEFGTNIVRDLLSPIGDVSAIIASV